ncbi:serine/threonine-protein phosphatase 6 regulatory subunit 2 [Cocos nucifera]|uniref:Serine/threonine-protein phosphatase 6 regulatory subunit 2 n=1 Tax=Cocos nucifera TaxID=13894 RepID=A0A8K0IMD8_COCNU|nr:serine/threonine-protein phosphatase 6 regulatory subunit 2 [Cocos nucifera]
MFWRIPNFSASSPVEFILDKENFTLEELLDEEEIIQECKALNTRLINFLRDRSQVEQLLRYIVEDAAEDADSKRSFKFPFIACEIITCEIDVILKTLVEDEELMNMLFSFLEPNHTHGSILAGYFSKVVICLMLRKTTQLMKYVQAHDTIFHQLVDMIGTTSIMEILIRLVGADDHIYANYVDIMQWLADTNLLEMIVDKLSPSSSPEVHANAAEVLWVIIRNAPSTLAAKLSSQSFVARIFGHMLEDLLCKSGLVHSLSVCIALLDPKRSASSAITNSVRSQHIYEPSIHVDPEIICALLPKLGDLLKRLDVSSDANTLPTTYGQLHPPLGKHRLKIVEFITVLLETGSDAAEKELIRSGAINGVIDLFFEYPYNNSLHHQVKRLIMSCLDSKHVAIVDHLFCECNIIQKFLQADKIPFLSRDSSAVTIPDAGRQPPRAGYIGHITQICNKLVQLGSSNDHIRAYLQESGEWTDWQSTVLCERNAMENVHQWACGRPTALQERTRDSDEDELHESDYDVTALANNLSQAFRYNVYENYDVNEVQGSLDQDDEDVYFDDESAEVVISSLRLGGDHQSCLFTNSNWFAFQEDSITEPVSTPAFDKMDDINIVGATDAGNSSDDEVVVGVDELTKSVSSQNEYPVTNSSLKNEVTLNGLTDATKVNVVDDVGLFRFDATENEDLFNDHSLPEWVGWREPSDIHVDGSGEFSTTSNPVETAVIPTADSMTGALACGSLVTSEFNEVEKANAMMPSLFEEDAEFVGVDMEGVGRAVERALGEGINGEGSAMKRNIVLKVAELQKPGEEAAGMMSPWRVEPEMGVVQE